MRVSISIYIFWFCINWTLSKNHLLIFYCLSRDKMLEGLFCLNFYLWTSSMLIYCNTGHFCYRTYSCVHSDCALTMENVFFRVGVRIILGRELNGSFCFVFSGKVGWRMTIWLCRFRTYLCYLIFCRRFSACCKIVPCFIPIVTQKEQHQSSNFHPWIFILSQGHWLLLAESRQSWLCWCDRLQPTNFVFSLRTEGGWSCCRGQCRRSTFAFPFFLFLGSIQLPTFWYWQNGSERSWG